MARHNVHDTLLKHHNFHDLLIAVGCKYKARGMLLVAYELAQDYWTEHRGIPKEKWPSDLDVLLRWDFARVEVRDGKEFIYVAGSAEAFKFKDSQSAKGRKGGKSKSPKKLANLRQNQKKYEAGSNPDRSPVNPTEVSSSSSNSESIPKTSSSGESASLPATVGAGKVAERRGKNAIALWLEAYHRKYGKRYELGKKDTGTLKHFGEPRDEEQIATLFAAYLAMKDKLYVDQAHPLSLFFRDLQKISVAAHTGIDPSVGEEPEWKKQARLEEERTRNASQ